MKQISTLIAFTFIALFTNAQFSENFDGKTTASLQTAGWTFINKASISGTSDKFIANTDKQSAFSTPFIKPAGTTTTLNISASYWFDNLSGNPTRTITITTSTGASTTVALTSSLSVLTFSQNIVVSNTTDWQQFTFTFSGSGGNSSTVAIDNLVITGLINSTSPTAPSPITLPIKLISFDAKYQAPNVTLNWSTAQEKNFSHFEVETSTDGSNFEQAGLVFGTGDADTQKDYAYQDKNIKMNGLVYYRLKSVDNDGKFSYSAVRIIRTVEATKTLSLSTYPNPAVSELRLTIPSNWQGKSVKMELYNGNGQKVMERTNTNASQTEVLNVNNLNKGMYVVKATCGTENAMEKVLKN